MSVFIKTSNGLEPIAGNTNKINDGASSQDATYSSERIDQLTEISKEPGNTLERKDDGLFTVGGGTYTDPDGATVSIGGWNVGDKANNMSIQEALYRLLHPYQKPSLTLGINPSTTVYDSVTGSIPSLKISANSTVKSKPITYVKFYFDGTLLSTLTTGVSTGGKFDYSYSPATPITGASGKSYEVKVAVSDGDNEVTAKTNITFIGKSYYGVIEGAALVLSDSVIKGLSSDLKNAKGAKYGFEAIYGRFVYAYPSSLGSLSSIKDVEHNVNYTDSVVTTNMTIDGIEYTVVYLKDAAGFDNIQITFA